MKGLPSETGSRTISRSRMRYVRQEQTIEVYSRNGLNPPVTSTHKNVGGLSHLNTFSGVTLPGWRDIIRNGGDATTAASGTEFFASLGFGSFLFGCRYDHPWNPNQNQVRRDEMYGNFSAISITKPQVTGDSSASLEARNRVIRKFLERCQAAQRSVSSGQSALELKQTLNAVTRPLSSLRQFSTRYLSDLNKRLRSKSRDLKQASKVVSDSYLEFTFGWNPLAKEIGTAIGAARKHRYPTVPVEASSSVTYNGSNLTARSGFQSGIITTETTRRRVSLVQHRLKGVIRTKSGDDGLVSLDQDFGLLARDFLPTVWEVIPWSFVADYFVNIGDMVSAWSYGFQDLNWACETIRDLTRDEYETRHISKPPVDFYVTQNSGGGFNSVVEVKNFVRRRVVYESLVPSLEFTIPGVGKPWLNIAALLSSNRSSIAKTISSLKR